MKNLESSRPRTFRSPPDTDPRHLDIPGAGGHAGLNTHRELLPTPSACPPIPVTPAPAYAHQISQSTYHDQIRHIVEPSPCELSCTGQLDTSGEQKNTILTGLQHKYPQTALILATEKCFAYCRYCFRRRFVGDNAGEVATDHAAIARYIREHPEINNALISGGDPFTLETRDLATIVDHLLSIPNLTSIRFGTKGIVFNPERFRDNELTAMFKRIIRAGKLPVIIAHVDHIGEVSPETEDRIRALGRIGVQFFNQAVLLNGVNDDPDVLAETFEKIHALGVRPYYLFQARPVRGAKHFQVPLRRGMDIVRAVNRKLSGIQKTFRFVMSHRTGKIEILDVSADDRVIMRYHQNSDPDKIGHVFSRPYRHGACWLDDLPLDPDDEV